MAMQKNFTVRMQRKGPDGWETFKTLHRETLDTAVRVAQQFTDPQTEAWVVSNYRGGMVQAQHYPRNPFKGLPNE